MYVSLDPSKSDFNWTRLANEFIKPEHTAQYRDVLRAYVETTDPAAPGQLARPGLQRQFNVFCRQQEANLIQNVRNILEADLVPPDAFERYIRLFNNAYEAYIPPKMISRQYYRTLRPLSHARLLDWLDVNPSLIPHFMASVKSHVNLGTTVSFNQAERTIENLISSAGFDLTRPSQTHRYPSTLSVDKAHDMIETVLLKLLWGKWVNVRFEVDVMKFSFPVLMLATVLRLFPKHLLAIEDRNRLDNWVFHHIVRPLLNRNQLVRIVWDDVRAQLGDYNYLSGGGRGIQGANNLALLGAGRYSPLVRYWGLDAFIDDGLPVYVDREAAATPYEAGLAGHRYRRFSSRQVLTDYDQLNQLVRLRDYANLMRGLRGGAPIGSPQTFETYKRFLMLLADQHRGILRMCKMFDEIQESVSRGFPCVPMDGHPPNHIDVVSPGAVDIYLVTAVPASAIWLTKWEEVQTLPLTLEYAAAGQALTNAFEAFVSTYRFVEQVYRPYAARTMKTEMIRDIREITATFAYSEIFDGVFQSMEDPIIKADFVVPLAANIRFTHLLQLYTNYYIANLYTFGMTETVYRSDTGSLMVAGNSGYYTPNFVVLPPPIDPGQVENIIYATPPYAPGMGPRTFFSQGERFVRMTVGYTLKETSSEPTEDVAPFTLSDSDLTLKPSVIPQYVTKDIATYDTNPLHDMFSRGTVWFPFNRADLNNHEIYRYAPDIHASMRLYTQTVVYDKSSNLFISFPDCTKVKKYSG
jgi:hypothetical protein